MRFEFHKEISIKISLFYFLNVIGVEIYDKYNMMEVMASVAQLVRVPVCGTGGRGFEPRHSPHIRLIYNNYFITRSFVVVDHF